MLTIEKDVESRLVKQAEKHGGICLKYPTIHTEGIPDRILLMPMGKVCFVELKRPKGGKLSEIQKYQIEKLRAIGIRVEVVKNYAEVDRLIRDLSEEPTEPHCPKEPTRCVFYDENLGCRRPIGWECHVEVRHDMDGSERR